MPNLLICPHPSRYLVSGEYLSAELDVFMKKVGFCILLQVLQHLVGLLEALFRFGFEELKIKMPN